MIVGTLFDGPLDVIGDVHGELGALEALLARLGYDRHGEHRQGRRLAFIGDLCDRGPDSPAVIRLVQRLVERGLAQCIAGNHELNLLRREDKHGNHWFFGRPSDDQRAKFGDCAWIEPDEQAAIFEFLATLPLVLERPDLRLVHAAWHQPSVDHCRAAATAVLDLYREHDVRVDAEAREQGLIAARDADLAEHDHLLHDASRAVPLLEGIGRYDEFYQLKNPVRVLSSGIERMTRKPFFAGGRWRMVERVPWWQDYAGDVPVLFGHYWRWWRPDSHARDSKGEPGLFEGIAADAWLPTSGRGEAFCLDYSVGARFKERLEGRDDSFRGRLAAMRWPERELLFDD